MRTAVLMKVLREESEKLEQELQRRLDNGMTKEEIVVRDPFFAGRIFQLNTITLRFIAEGGLDDRRSTR